VKPSQAGIYVQPLDSNQPLLSANPAAAFNPASTIKLMTTWLALSELGPDRTWDTEVYLGGKLERGVLQGDLILKGYGDPYLITERLWALQRQLKLRGLRRIDGDLIIDNSYFAVEDTNPGAFDGEELRVYNVLPDALLVNFQAIRLYFSPDPARNSVRVFGDPMPVNLAIENRMRLKPGRCGGFRNGVKLELQGGAERNRLIVSGNYGQDCKLWSMTRSVLTGPSYAYGVFRSLWEESGGVINGTFRVDPNALANFPEDREPFLVVESPPLGDVIRSINKYSNNVMSRHLFLTLGADTFGAPATSAKGRRAAELVLRRQGLELAGLYMENGAGLSRDTRVSAGGLARVLINAGNSPWFAEYVSSMSLAGLDGTLKKRFKTEPATGRMHLKTGRLDGVYATAGYVHAASGRDYVVVILQNYPDADRGPGEEAQAALLRWVYEH
jgi:D-alanyl-D-alanine carboxypeptidase/D-alanyl-D-alanine-endopeptidase (penicillin-binding protein 4)